MSLLLAFQGAPPAAPDYVQPLFETWPDDEEELFIHQWLDADQFDYIQALFDAPDDGEQLDERDVFIDQTILVEALVDSIIEALADGPDDEVLDGDAVVILWDGSFDAEPPVVIEVSEWLIRARRRGRRA